MRKIFNPRFLMAAGLVVLGALSRLLPHEYNLTPIMSIALFAGVFIDDKRFAFIIPFAAMFFSDIFIGFHTSMPAVYIAFAAGVGIGLILRRKVSVGNIALSALAGSVIFFLLTNFWVWLFEGMYSLNTAGLIDCYVKAIPFFRGTLIGDAVYCLVMFGGFALAERFIPSIKAVAVTEN